MCLKPMGALLQLCRLMIFRELQAAALETERSACSKEARLEHALHKSPQMNGNVALSVQVV